LKKKRLLKDEKIVQKVYNNLNQNGKTSKEEYDNLNKLISSTELSHDDIRMIIRIMQLLKKNSENNHYKEDVHSLVDSTTQSILKVLFS